MVNIKNLYFGIVLERCDTWIWHCDDEDTTFHSDWKDDFTDNGTVLSMYPSDSVSHLQVHFLVNGTVEFHRYETHEVIGSFSMKEFVNNYWTNKISPGIASQINDWMTLTGDLK